MKRASPRGVPHTPTLPDLPTRRARALLALLARLPQGALSRAFGRVADVRLPRPLRRPLLGAFARLVGADVGEAAVPLEAYPSLNRFFTRELKPGAREWPEDARVLASPVDGTAGQVGIVRAGAAVQAKGREYSVAALLGNPTAAERFEGGTFITLYLSPSDYHRIHAPCDGSITLARYLPGSLLPVNLPAVMHVPELFPRNERLVCYLDGPLGQVAVVAVGAYNVGRISAAFDPRWSAPAGEESWVTNRRGAVPSDRRYDPPVRVEQGDEIMTFHLGSTVVLLTEPGRVVLDGAVEPGRRVRLGEALAHDIP